MEYFLSSDFITAEQETEQSITLKLTNHHLMGKMAAAWESGLKLNRRRPVNLQRLYRKGECRHALARGSASPYAPGSALTYHCALECGRVGGGRVLTGVTGHQPHGLP